MRQYASIQCGVAFAAIVLLGTVAAAQPGPVQTNNAETEIARLGDPKPGPVSLRAQLQALAARGGFQVDGIELIGDEAAGPRLKDTTEQLRHLLQRYSYVMLLDDTGKPREIRIVAKRRPRTRTSERTPGRHAIKTTRRGVHHQVTAKLVGPNDAMRRVSLIVDTGATAIVLPESMMGPLGFEDAMLKKGFSNTANGKVGVKRGTLRSVMVGDVEARDVLVSFIADDRVGGTRLLGMSFLNRFRFSIDDTKNELTLLVR